GLDRAGVEVIRGEARFAGPRALEVSGDGSALTLSADLIFINTGLRPAIPPLPGLRDVPYLTSTSIMQLRELPGHLVVLGGGYVGLEFAQMFRRFGSRVTVLQYGPQLLPREDGDVAAEVARILAQDGINVVLDTEATAVRATDGEIILSYQASGGASPMTLRGSHLLVATGRVPNTDDLNFGAASVETDRRGFVKVNQRLETTAPGVYALGDVTGGPAFTHISYDDFRILRTNLLHGGSATTAGRLVPYTVFIDPQLGRIGMTEREATAAGRTVRVAKLPMSHVARALEVDETRGFMKAVVDADSGRILGAAVLGIEGGEIATLFQIAMMGGLPYGALRDGVFSHPTLAESLNSVFMAMDPESSADTKEIAARGGASLAEEGRR
ncbi:MAG: FAD-dependent oxidoreductase, partial [Gemmatimonadaceae bacterium]